MNIKKIRYNGKPAEALYTPNPIMLGFRTEAYDDNGVVITERIYVDKELRHLNTSEYFVYYISQHTITKDFTQSINENMATTEDVLCEIDMASDDKVAELEEALCELDERIGGLL